MNQIGETNLPGVFAAGDVAGYEGKITLITVGFSEAALAANHAVARIRGEKAQPEVLDRVGRSVSRLPRRTA